MARKKVDRTPEIRKAVESMGELKMLGPRELSLLTGIPVRTITRLSAQGLIPAVKVGRQWRFIRTDVERWLRTTASNTKHRALVVDDNKDLLDLMRLVLGRMGAEVVAAAGGKEALEILEKDRRFSILVLDLNMPVVSGVQVLGWMAGAGVDIATIVFTGFPDGDLMAEAMRYKHFTLLKKPATADRIQQVVGAVLRGVDQLPA